MAEQLGIITIVAWVQSLAQEFLHASGMAKKQKWKKNMNKLFSLCKYFQYFIEVYWLIAIY